MILLIVQVHLSQLSFMYSKKSIKMRFESYSLLIQHYFLFYWYMII